MLHAQRPPAAASDDPGKLLQLLDSLPTLPVVAIRLGEILHAPRATVTEVADLIAADPSLSGKLLRLVNSAYFGIPGGVTDVARAIPFVGFNTIYQLVLSVSVLTALRTPSGSVFDPRPLWMHSLAVGSAARVIAEDLRHGDPGAMFTAGLLHDMGKIALAKVAPEQFLRAVEVQRTDGVASSVAEARVGLPGHDRVGADLARRWRLPSTLTAPIECHHAVRTPEHRSRLAPALRHNAEIVAVADLVSRAVAVTAGQAAPIEEPETRGFLTALGVSEEACNSFHHRVMRQLERSRPFLDLIQ